MSHPYSNVVIASGFNTKQARRLEEYSSVSITVEAALGALGAAGLPVEEVDAVLGEHALDVIYTLGMGPCRGTLRHDKCFGMVLDAIHGIAVGVYSAVLIVGGQAGRDTGGKETPPWTRPDNEFVMPFGLFTAVEFALIARRHMELFGTTPEQLAKVAATIRNNGHANPEAVYFGRGPFASDDILKSRMVADPFHLLDCASVAEGGSAILLTSRSRAKDLALSPVSILGAGIDHFGPSYRHAPTWDLRWNGPKDVPNGYVGRRAARRSFKMAGLGPDDVDCCELYDPFSFEVIRQLEAFEFCGDGEGGDLADSGALEPGGRWPISTDGGLLSFSHVGWAQMVQRIVRGVEQLQGRCATTQVSGAEVALCTSGGAGALSCEVMLLGSEEP
jgi:acetyl-CoA acetyltransferase